METWYQKNKEKAKLYSHNYYIKNQEKYKSYGREYFLNKRRYFNNKCRIYSYSIKGKFGFGKRKAKRYNLEWTLGINIYTILINKPCVYCNKSLLNEMGIGLDRIDNTKGYILGNILPCCGDCNKTRGNRFTVEEMKIMIKAVKHYRDKNLLSGELVH